MQTTKRLRIEPLRESHAEALFPALLDERIYAFIPARRHLTAADLAERFAKLAAGSPDPGEQWLNWGLFRRDDGAAIGYAQATVSVAERTAWVAYVLTPAAWGQGYATEALAWLLQHLACAREVERARARIDTRNVASIAVVQRLQFEKTQALVEDGVVDHVYEKSLSPD